MNNSNDERFGYVINVARGGLIDEEALGRALDAELIAGAGIDVFVNEPAKDLPFSTTLPPSPHLGASTEEAQKSRSGCPQFLALAGELVPALVLQAVLSALRSWVSPAKKLSRILSAVMKGVSVSAIEVEVVNELAERNIDSLKLAALKGSSPTSSPATSHM